MGMEIRLNKLRQVAEGERYVRDSKPYQALDQHLKDRVVSQWHQRLGKIHCERPQSHPFATC
jgi:hypothetical protein